MQSAFALMMAAMMGSVPQQPVTADAGTERSPTQSVPLSQLPQPNREGVKNPLPILPTSGEDTPPTVAAVRTMVQTTTVAQDEAPDKPSPGFELPAKLATRLSQATTFLQGESVSEIHPKAEQRIASLKPGLSAGMDSDSGVSATSGMDATAEQSRPSPLLRSMPEPAAHPSSEATTPLVGGVAGMTVAAADTQPVQTSDGKPNAILSPLDQVAEQVQVSLFRGEHEATIRLEPAELGKVHVQLQVKDGQLHLSIQAERASTGRLLDRKMAELRHNLEGQGIKVGELALVAHQRHGLAGSEGAQREVVQALRPSQMEMNSSAQQHSSAQQQTAFGNGGSGGGNRGGAQHTPQQPSSAATGNQPTEPQSPHPAAEPTRRSVYSGQTVDPGVDYYA